MLGSGGWIRTSDQLINSQLRYHCATPERGVENGTYDTIEPFRAQVGISGFFQSRLSGVRSAGHLNNSQWYALRCFRTFGAEVRTSLPTISGPLRTIPPAAAVGFRLGSFRSEISSPFPNSGHAIENYSRAPWEVARLSAVVQRTGFEARTFLDE